MINTFFIFHEWALFILRVVLGLIFIAHGFPKLKTIAAIGLRPRELWRVLVGIVESVGGAFLLVGLFTSYVSIVLMVLVVLTILLGKLFHTTKLTYSYGLYLLLLAGLFVVGSTGSAIFSVDEYLRLFLR